MFTKQNSQNEKKYTTDDTIKAYNDGKKALEEKLGPILQDKLQGTIPEAVARALTEPASVIAPLVDALLETPPSLNRVAPYSYNKFDLIDNPSPQTADQPILSTATATAESAQTPQIKSKLSYMLDEFYSAQAIFHNNMKSLVEVLTKNPPPSFQATEKRKLLDVLLEPFKILANNPFNQESRTRDEQADLLHIMSVIDENNVAFRATLRALANAISCSEFAKTLIDELEKDVAKLEAIKRELGCTNLKVVRGYFDQPVQTLCRYMLFLKQVKPELVYAGNLEARNTIDKFIIAVRTFAPQIDTINDKLAEIKLLTEIEYTLIGMSTLDHVKKEQELKEQLLNSSTFTKHMGDDHNLDETLSIRIDATLACICMGKIKILKGQEDIPALYNILLRDFLTEITEKNETLQKAANNSLYAKTTSAFSYMTSSVYHTVFRSANDNTFSASNLQTKLKKLMEEMQKVVDLAERLEQIQNKKQ